jgi:uncharacterized cysteine cluster protein YcgN (CxxCxxCC family)
MSGTPPEETPANGQTKPRQTAAPAFSRFFETTPLAAMTREEWESLCCGCGRCCLVKLKNGATGTIHTTSVACRYLDPWSCSCAVYAERSAWTACCVAFSCDTPEVFAWLPESCAYRLLYEGKPLPEWHHLVSGNRETVHAAGVSVRGKITRAKQITWERLARALDP